MLPIKKYRAWAYASKLHKPRIIIRIPIVEMNVVLNASSEKRKRRQVFPTPLSPIRSSLNK